VVVDDPDLRGAVGEQYRRTTEPVVAKILAAKEAAGDDAGARISSSILYLAEHMGEVPVIVLPCYDIEAAASRYGGWIGPSAAPSKMESGMYASIYPAVWSFQLALRSRGLGSVLTTAHQSDQPAMAEILGIPTTWDQTCLIPVAYTIGGDFTPSPRAPVEDSIVWNGGR
jgi:nitroreductase